MRVLFIDPPGNQKPKEGKPGGGLSLAIATLASVLIKHGHQVSLYDMANHYENRTIDSINKSLDIFMPDFIGITILNAQYTFAIEIVKKLRKLTDVPIIVGGAEVTALKEEIFYDMDFAIDVSVLGEGEESFLEILEAYKNNSSSTLIDKLRKINGIIINNDRSVIKTGDVQLVSNLDDYPPPDFSIFGVKRWRMYRLQGSRGCPFNCSFCYQYLGDSWRKRSPKKIIEDLLGAYKKYNYTYIRFLDPVFNFRIEWVHELCDELIASGLSDIPWEAQGVRADKINEDLCKKMVKAGCKKVFIGVESLHPEVFKLIKKGESIESIKRGVSISVQHFEEVSVFFIIGLPNDTKERSLYTYNEVKKLKPTGISFSLAVPYSGTRLLEWVNEQATIIGSSHNTYTRGSQAFESGVAYETKEFTKEERLDVFRIFNTKEFRYVSESKIHYYLDPLLWLKDAFGYDRENIDKHLFHVSANYLNRFYQKFKSIALGDKRGYEIEYERVPNGTWWIN